MSTPSRPPITVDNPAFNYDQSGHDYSGIRRADPRIAGEIHAALGEAKTVLNVGAGSGSYEPVDRYVVPLELSNVMRRQRPGHLAPALIGTADAIPFDDGAFDASMVVLSRSPSMRGPTPFLIHRYAARSPRGAFCLRVSRSAS